MGFARQHGRDGVSVQAIWGGAAAMVGIALVAAWRERRRRRRCDPDAVGPVDWLTVQAGALIAAGVLALLAVRSGG